MIRFDNRTAIVTGAGTGLGRAHAKLLATRGANVVVNDIADKTGAPAADAVVAEITKAGGVAVAHLSDITDRQEATELVDCAVSKFGGIDIVVNNAGILRPSPFEEMSLEDFEAILRVHLLGSLNVTQLAWPHMTANRYGRIVFTTSGAGLAGAVGNANYGAAKAALLGLMNVLKYEGREAGILVNMISPVAGTQMSRHVFDDSFFSFAKPEKVTAAVAWLCSDACDVTGEIIAAGAGYFARIKVVRSQGLVLDEPSPEAFAEAKAAIFDLTDAQAYEKTLDDSVLTRLQLT